jgi:hypothetical protein
MHRYAGKGAEALYLAGLCPPRWESDYGPQADGVNASKHPLDTRKQARTRGTMVQEQLRNWAWWLAGYVGPPVQDKAASAEGNYVSDEIWDGHDPKYEPDQLAGERVEEIVRNLPSFSRIVLKAAYVQYPYHLRTQLLHNALRSPQTGTGQSLKKHTNWLPNR